MGRSPISFSNLVLQSRIVSNIQILTFSILIVVQISPKPIVSVQSVQSHFFLKSVSLFSSGTIFDIFCLLNQNYLLDTFFLSFLGFEDPTNHQTKRMVNIRLTTQDPRDCTGTSLLSHFFALMIGRDWPRLVRPLAQSLLGSPRTLIRRRVPGLPIRDCARGCSNYCGHTRPIDVTEI